MELKTQADVPWRPVVCRINTDEGISGWGEAAMAYGVGASAAFGMIKDLAGIIIGMNPLQNEIIWDKMYRETFWGQNGGVVVHAGMSAIDLALWDIKGKKYGVPLYELLGGKRRDKLRAYASQLQFGWYDKVIAAVTPDDYYKAAKAAVADGYDAVKVDFFQFDEKGNPTTPELTTRLLAPRTLNMIEQRIAAVREAIGPHVDIIVENHSFTDVQSAIQIGQMAEKYNIFAYEEVTTPDPKLHRRVAERVNIPIASGERVYTRWEYQEYFEDRSIGLIQPDLGTCGGITEGKKICDLAAIYDVGVQVHVCSSPLCVAASLHLEAVIPNFTIHEHHVFFRMPWNKRLCKYDYQPVNGYISIPDLPGLGNEISDEAIAEATIETVTKATNWQPDPETMAA